MKPLVLDDVTKRYKEVVALDGVSVEIEAGRVTGFLGRNGAGKTTALRALLGLVEPDEGRALVQGRPMEELEHPARVVGAVLEPAFHPRRRAVDHLWTLALAADLPSARVTEVLELVGLAPAARRRIGGFSLGMRQRLALAAALLGDPAILVLDEPTNGLDPDGVRWLRALIRSFRDEGRTVLVSSHLLAEVAETADDVVIIERGRLIGHRALRELIDPDEYEVRTPEADKLIAALARVGSTATVTGTGVRVSGMPAAEIGRAVAQAGVVVYEMRRREPSLEEVFFDLTESTRSAR